MNLELRQTSLVQKFGYEKQLQGFLEKAERLASPTLFSDLRFPSTHITGIPDLNISLQAGKIKTPFEIWGAITRTSKMLGTYAFYTKDEKIEGVWNNPKKIIDSGCQITIEPNFSILARMPLMVVLYYIFRKRWLSCLFQSHGIQIIVDLNVAPNYAEANLIGVPKGWRSYATRAHYGYHEWMDFEYKVACHHAETKDVLFIVYGGTTGKDVWKKCQDHGWIHIEDRMSTIRRLKKQGEL